MKLLLALASLTIAINCYASEPSSNLIKELDSINEQPIKNLATSANKEVYRFYWSRNSKSTITYTVDLTETDNSTLIIKKFSKKEPRTLISTKETKLKKSPPEPSKLSKWRTILDTTFRKEGGRT